MILAANTRDTLPVQFQGLQQRIMELDPSVELLFNNRIMRWVVAQFGPDLLPVHQALLGVLKITGEMTHYSPVFVCELAKDDTWAPGQGDPVRPGPWILDKLARLQHYKHRTMAQYEADVAKEKAANDAENDRKLADAGANMKTELANYGGDLIPGLKSKRHITISGNPLNG